MMVASVSSRGENGETLTGIFFPISFHEPAAMTASSDCRLCSWAARSALMQFQEMDADRSHESRPREQLFLHHPTTPGVLHRIYVDTFHFFQTIKDNSFHYHIYLFTPELELFRIRSEMLQELEIFVYFSVISVD